MTTEPEMFGALSIDTQTIQKEGFRFDRGSLNLLRQFRGSSIQVILPSIVVNETLSHLEEAIRAARSALRKAVTDAERFHLPLAIITSTDDLDKINPREIASAELEIYLKAIGAEAIGAGRADLEDIERRYFQTLPPFAGINNKKHEFPDAIALSALDSWAKAKGKRVLAVSGDKEWAGYDSGLIRVVQSISEALGILQQDPEHRANLFMTKSLNELLLRKSYPQAAEFARLLEQAVSVIDFDVEAESDMAYDADYPDVKLKGYTFWEDFTLVKISADEIVAELNTTVTVDVTVDITFSIYDSVDKDEVPMGGTSIIREHELDDTQLLVTFINAFDAEGWEVSDVEISSIERAINLGFVEPDWRSQRSYED